MRGIMVAAGDPVISVIIPTRNRPVLVKRAVLSALSQVEHCIEVVVVVDGPDRATVEELSRIGDPRIRIVSLEKSVGGAEARNVGARHARGEWIALLDDDDEWLPGKLGAQLKAAQENGNGYTVVTSRYIVRRAGEPEVLRPRRLPQPHEPLSEYMFDYLCYFQTSTFFCSKSLFLRVPFDKELSSFQDIDWFLRVVTTEGVKPAVVEKPLAIYYAPEERATITSKAGWRERLAWGQKNRHRMTRRAYARFITGSCVGRAVQDRAGFRGFATLLRECVLRGNPSPMHLFLMTGMFLVSPATRRKIRDAFFLPAYKPATQADA